MTNGKNRDSRAETASRPIAGLDSDPAVVLRRAEELLAQGERSSARSLLLTLIDSADLASPEHHVQALILAGQVEREMGRAEECSNLLAKA